LEFSCGILKVFFFAFLLHEVFSFVSFVRTATRPAPYGIEYLAKFVFAMPYQQKKPQKYQTLNYI
jgi:hypothetical protein